MRLQRVLEKSTTAAVRSGRRAEAKQHHRRRIVAAWRAVVPCSATTTCRSPCITPWVS